MKFHAVRYIEDDKSLKDSTSGGFFLGIANYVIEKKGIVYGAAFDDKNILHHLAINKLDEVNKLQGSKYVQSNLGKTFLNIKNNLADNSLVLFTGTPCQTNSLIKFLGNHPDNLILMDFTCHGVPSPFFFSSYLKWLLKKLGLLDKEINYVFRSKKKGWYFKRQMSYMYKINDKHRYAESDPYYLNFLKGNCYRECCYSCKFKLYDSNSDFSVGDFGGVDLLYPDFMDKRGISYVICKNEKAYQIMNEMKERFTLIDIEPDLLFKYNKTILSPVKRPILRETFYYEMMDNPDDFMNDLNNRIKLINKIKPHIPACIIKIIKTFKTK